MTTAQAAVATLIGHGIDTVFGVPGVHTDPFFDALHGEQARIRMLHARHEQAARLHGARRRAGDRAAPIRSSSCPDPAC